LAPVLTDSRIELLERPECEINALCDVSRQAIEDRLALIQSIRPGVDVDIQTEYRALLANRALDGVVVLLPHHLHYPVVKDALEAGKHVLVEKPMVTEVVHARDLIETAARANRLLAIAYQRAYLPEYVYVRGMVERGELGTIRFVSAHLEQSWFQRAAAATVKDNWRRDPHLAGGGQLVDTGSHTLAAMLDVTQLAPHEVFAYTDTCGLDVDVNTAMAIRFAEGALGTATIGGFGHSVTEVLRVVGDQASARIFFRTVREQSLEIEGQAVDAPSLVPPSNPDANFVQAVQGKDVVSATGELGLRVAQLSEAAYQSAAQHGPVSIA
jgi:predicted dehydrogenase